MIEIVLTSSALILLLAILRRALRGKINPCLQYALWLLVAVRLLIPGTLFTAPVCVLGAAEGLQATLHQTFPDPDGLPEPTINDILNQLPQPVPAQPPQAAYPDGDTVIIRQPAVTEITQRVYNWPDMIWKTGVAVTGGAMAVSNLVFYLRLRKNRKQLVLPAAPWSGKLPVYETEGLPSPCLFGLFRPGIYLNEAAMSAGRPEHILVHEYAHYRHGDHVWAVLRCVCLAVHWYNPLVWWAAELSRRDCELACDEGALRRLGDGARIDYGHTLLGMVSKGRNPAALLQTATTMTAGKRAMKERIALIVKQPKMRKITMVLVALAVCGAVAVTFGGKAVAAETEPAPGETMPSAVTIMQVFSSQSGDTSHITDPEEVARLWALYQSFEYEGPYDARGMQGWPIWVSFQFGDEPGDDTDVFFLLDEHGVYTQDRENLRLKNIDAIYAEFLRMSRSAPITSSAPTREEAAAQLEADLSAGIFASPGEMTLRSAGSTFQFKLANASGIYALTYTSSDTRVAEVDGNGVVTAVGPGEAVISLHYEGAGGPLDFECRVRCEWADTPAADDAAVLYADEITEWEQWFQSYMDGLSAAPDGEIIYDSMDERSLYGQVHAYLYPYASDYFGEGFAQNCYAYDVQLGFSVPNELTQPQLTMTMQYYVIVFATVQLPNGELHSLRLTSRELTTTLMVTDQMNMMTQMLADGASGNLPGTGETEPSSETINAWQRAFFGFVFELPAMPDQELAYDGQAENGLEQAVLSALEEYYRSYVAEHGNSAHNDRFSRIILESEIPDFAEYKERITVAYRVECQNEREWNGVTYPVAPQTGDHLSTTFTVYQLGGMLTAGPPMPHNTSYTCTLTPGTASGENNWNLDYIRRDIQARTESRMQLDSALSHWSVTSVEFAAGHGSLPENIAPGDTAEVQYNLHVTYNGASGYNTVIGPLSVVYTFSE